MSEPALVAGVEILRGLVGSTIHGLALEGTDDRDEMGVCIEHPEYVAGLERFEQLVYRTQPEGVRSGPGDLDLTIYSARKYARLALQGNPSILLLLFVPSEHLVVDSPLGRDLQALAPAFASRQAGKRFLGYLQAQRDRLLGLRGGRHTNRPELEAEHGYDTKYAMHMARLGFQGVEFLSTGRITLPMPEPERSFCMAVRRGELAKEMVLLKVAEIERRLVGLLDSSPLAPSPDRDAVNVWLMRAHETVWGDRAGNQE